MKSSARLIAKPISLIYSLTLGCLPFTIEAQEQQGTSESSEPALEEVIVVGSRQGDFSVITEDSQKLVDMPGALGDPIAAVYSLPGVVYSSNGGEPAVRGASPDDNRFFVDYMPTGYVFHNFTNSVFSEFILHDFQMYSAGFGPEYANVTGAVFDIKLRDPANEAFGGVVDLSMLRSGVFVESGLGDNAAFYISARQSMIHLFISEGDEEDGLIVQKAPQDSDYQAKLKWDISDRHSLSFSANGARDEAAANFTRESDFVRSNPDFEGDARLLDDYDAQYVIWDYQADSGLSTKLGIGNTDLLYDVSWGDEYYFNYQQQQQNLRGQINLPEWSGHQLSLGGFQQGVDYQLSYDQILFICTEFEPDCSLNRMQRISDKLPLEVNETMTYINDSWSINSKVAVDLGLQSHHNDYTEETFINPRLSLRYQMNQDWVVKAKYGRYNRLPNVEYITPQIGNPNLKSSTAKHYTLGIEQSLDDGWSWSLEAYYKTMHNLPLGVTAEDAEELYVNEVEGEARGLDLFINKNITDRWYGWLALSYAKSERTNQLSGETKDYMLDTPIIFNWVMNWQKSEKLNIGWRWTMRSGAPYTPIIDVDPNQYFEDAVQPEYGDPYSKRLPLYSQLDLRFKWDLTVFGGYDSAVILDIINLLNQKNVTEKGLDYEAYDNYGDYSELEGPGDEVKTQESAGPGIIPALTFRLYF